MPRQTNLLDYEKMMSGVNPEGFHQTPNFMTIKAIHARLTAADWALWGYLQAIEPHGDRVVELSVSRLGEVIGVSERQIKRSLARLKELGLYHWEPVIIRGQNLTGKVAKELCRKKKEATCAQKPKQESSAQGKMTTLSSGGQLCHQVDKVVIGLTTLSPNGQLCPNQESKPLSDKGFSSPHTSQTYSDFIDTLSDSEREIFENFVREEWKKAKGEDVINMERFLAKEADFKSWQQKFLSSPVGKEAKKQAIAAQFDWRNDPRFDDWIWKAFNGGYPWTQENEAEREQRYAFWEWAQDTNAYEGVCYQ